MSYRFDMGFKEVSSFEEALVYAVNAVKVLNKREHIEDMIRDNMLCLPYFRHVRKDKKDDKQWKALAIDASEKTVNGDILSVRFVYFKKQKLLGVCGTYYPEEFKTLFDKFFYFQNSCDQDYERDCYPTIPFFTNIFDDCMKLTPNEIYDVIPYAKDCIDDDDSLNYYRRTAAYEKIYNTLHLDEWLWGHDDEAFERFTLSAVLTAEDKAYVNRVVRKLVKEEDIYEI